MPSVSSLVRTMAIALGISLCSAFVQDARAATAGAPPSQYAPIDPKSGVVFDRKTRLIWERAPQPELMTYTAAESYCSRLQLNGSSGWRLPTLRELLTLLDPRTSKPSIDRTAFPSTPFADPYWTSTEYQAKERVGCQVGQKCPWTWMVDFSAGTADPYNSTVKQGRVRCVRNK